MRSPLFRGEFADGVELTSPGPPCGYRHCSRRRPSWRAVGALHTQCLGRPALPEQTDKLPFALRMLTEGGEDLWHLFGAKRPPRQIDDRPGLDRGALLVIAKSHELEAVLLLQPQKLQGLPRAEQSPSALPVEPRRVLPMPRRV
jgi:hypothetical protein